MKKKMKKSNFTLLELLIVVAILAIIGGGMIAAYDGLEEDAAQGAATRDIAALDQAFRTFKVVEKGLPNNLESLLAADVSGATITMSGTDNVVAELSAAPTLTSGLASKVAGKFGVRALTADQLDNLRDSGLTLVRYIDAQGDDETESDLDINAADGTAATAVGPMSQIDIPQHMFESPRPGNGRDRGRGFVLDLADAGFDATNVQFAVWDDQDPAAPVDNYNNVKVGAPANAVLVGFGIGNASTLITSGSEAGLAHAPYYANVAKEKYNHYIALIDVNQSPAKLVAIVDSRGDFLDEEYAEHTDQKQ